MGFSPRSGYQFSAEGRAAKLERLSKERSEGLALPRARNVYRLSVIRQGTRLLDVRRARNG